jgi:hypothetical protein
MTEREIGFLKMFCERVGGRTDRKQGVLARKIGTGEDTENIALAGSLEEQGYLYINSTCAHEDWYLSRKGKKWVEDHR